MRRSYQSVVPSRQGLNIINHSSRFEFTERSIGSVEIEMARVKATTGPFLVGLVFLVVGVPDRGEKQALGISRRALYRLISKYRLDLSVSEALS